MTITITHLESTVLPKQSNSILQEQFGREIRDGSLRPIIDSVFPLGDASDAHSRMASNQHFGKIILSVKAL